MVPPYQGDAIWVADFEAEQQQEAFQRVETSVDEIAHEEVVCVWYVAAHAEQLHQVVKLAVNVATYCDRGVDLNDVTFFDEELAGFVAEVADGGFGDGFAGSEVGDGAGW